MTGRLVAHAVVLEDGRVFVVGNDSVYDQGEITRDDTAKAEIWDPVADRWMATGTLNKPRGAFALVTLAGGRVLVAGGLNQGGSGCGTGTPQSFSSAYLFDPRTGHETWDRTGLLTTARTSPAIATLPDGRVLVAGGYFRIDQGMAVLTPDVTAGTAVTRSGSVGTATLAAFAPPLADVSVPPYGRALATAEIFDPATGEWSKTGSMRYARVGDVGVTLSDRRILVVGSSEDNAMVSDGAYTTSEIYDPATGTFSRSGSLPGIDRAALKRVGTPVPDYDPAPLDEGTLVALDDGGAVLIGQSGWWKHEGEITRSFRFDAAKGTWREIGTTWVAGWSHEEPYTEWKTPGTRLLHATTVRLRDGRLLVAGGNAAGMEGGSSPTRSAQIYDPATNVWSQLPKMPVARAGGTGVLLADGSVLIVGGFSGKDGGWGSCDAAGGLASVVRFVP